MVLVESRRSGLAALHYSFDAAESRDNPSKVCLN